jgi:hypothetical protein
MTAGPATLVRLTALAVLGAAWLALVQPRIGVRDADAYAYIAGAMSLRAGHGYVDLLGQSLTHWPPGYAWLLSWGSDPLRLAAVVNDLGFGVAVAALWRAAVTTGWSVLAALGLTVALASGFLRGVATNAAPDILVYAVFLAVLPAYVVPGRRWWLPYLAWTVLIPVKLIAVIFVPAALLAAWWSPTPVPRGRLAAILGGWVLVCASVLAFNRLTGGAYVPASHGASSVGALVTFGRLALTGIGRDGLAFWYGSIRPWSVLVPVALVALLGLFCLRSLEPRATARPARTFGLAFFAVALGLLAWRDFSGGWRLTGYGFVLLVLGFVPRPETSSRWIVYAVSCATLAMINAVLVNSLGANDPRYARLAALMGAGIGAPVASNSFHLLDLHAGLASSPVHDWSEVTGGEVFRVDLPRYDGIATPVWPLTGASAGWCEIKAVEGGAVLRRCPGQ